ncbi:MAG: MobF family relaxase [Solirubrobacteraceae bacterium]
MLTVAKVTSGQAAGYAVYLENRTLAPELGDYYLRGGERVEAPGRWVTGAELVSADPHAAVSGEQLRALMAVQHPATGLPLRRVGGNGQAVSALDLTFSAPKSVSAVWALASPELRAQLEQAHEAAVDRALAYAVEQVPMVRRRVDRERVDHVCAADLVATSWRHTTARAVAEHAPDPQLHSHALLHAAVRSDGELVAIDSRSIFVHRRELGAAYRTTLAAELHQLGFQIQRGTGRGERYFELAGVPQALIDRWSSRHHQVHEAIQARIADKRQTLQALVAGGGPGARDATVALEGLERSGRLLPSEERFMATHTRAPKNQLATHGDLDQHWHQAGQEFAFDGRAVQQLLEPDRALPEPATGAQLLDRLTEFDATFTDREARAVALEASAGASIDQALGTLDSLDRANVLLELADGRLTTIRHRSAEQQTITAAERLAAARPDPLPTELVEHQALTLDAELRAHGAQLSPEQHQALWLACSDRQMVMIEGQAGTGKSTTLTAIARAHQADGRQLVVTSTAALAAQHLATELGVAGVDADAYSTAALQAAIQAGGLVLDERTTVIHDEAALASTREQHQLLAAVKDSGSRIILIGDPRQNQAVGAGGLWPDLQAAAQANSAYVQLTQIVRAHDPHDRRDQTLFRAGQHQRALHGYSDRGRVHLADEQRQAEDHALDAAQADRNAGRRTLVICQTSNEHLDQLNARAQAIRAQDGQLGQQALPLAGRPYGLRSGDLIQIRRGLDHPTLGRVANGATGQIIDIDGDQATVALSDGRQGVLSRQQADQASVRLAYVAHPFPAQGHTTDTTHLIVLEHATQEGSYVALTRARHATHIHAPLTPDDAGDKREREPNAQLELFRQPQPDQDPIAQLAQRMGRSEPEIASIHTPLAHEQHLNDQHARQQAPRVWPGRDLDDPPARERVQPTGPGSDAQRRSWPGRDLDRGDVDQAAGRDRAQDPGPEPDAGEHRHQHDREGERVWPGRASTPESAGAGRREDEQQARDRYQRELADRLARARQARDHAQRVLDGYPAASERQHRHALEQIEQTAQHLAEHETLADQLDDQLDRLGPIARRRQPGLALRAQIDFIDTAIGLDDRALIDLDQTATRHQTVIKDWQRDHPDAREQLADTEHELEDVIDLEARRRIEAPGEHLTHALGRPPAPEHRQRGLWEHAALQIERYRTRYQIDPQEPTVLGPEPERHSATRQQRDELDSARTAIVMAATRLGAPGHAHTVKPQDLTRPAPTRTRGIDRDGPSIGFGF